MPALLRVDHYARILSHARVEIDVAAAGDTRARMLSKVAGAAIDAALAVARAAAEEHGGDRDVSCIAATLTNLVPTGDV